jgi:hypothetical protein
MRACGKVTFAPGTKLKYPTKAAAWNETEEQERSTTEIGRWLHGARDRGALPRREDAEANTYATFLRGLVEQSHPA